MLRDTLQARIHWAGILDILPVNGCLSHCLSSQLLTLKQGIWFIKFICINVLMRDLNHLLISD